MIEIGTSSKPKGTAPGPPGKDKSAPIPPPPRALLASTQAPAFVRPQVPPVLPKAATETAQAAFGLYGAKPKAPGRISKPPAFNKPPAALPTSSKGVADPDMTAAHPFGVTAGSGTTGNRAIAGSGITGSGVSGNKAIAGSGTTGSAKPPLVRPQTAHDTADTRGPASKAQAKETTVASFATNNNTTARAAAASSSRSPTSGGAGGGVTPVETTEIDLDHV